MGNVPLDRIVFDPPPGTATVADVIRLIDGDQKCAVELVNGTLVEKPMGLRESQIAIEVSNRIYNFQKPRQLGVVTGEHGTIRMVLGNVRIPDVAFFRRSALPDGCLPSEPAPQLAPALAVEVLSASNTEEEMRIKVREYFESGVELVWMLDPQLETLRAYDAPERFRQLTRDEVVDAGNVLPGFSVRVGDLFDV